ncbi:unnamed protein product, partial [Allacma fusca]
YFGYNLFHKFWTKHTRLLPPETG